MSITETPRRAGPYATNGVQTEFAFAFKVFEEGDVVVTSSENGADTELALTTDYVVELNADQDASPGGTVTLAVAPDGPTITLTSGMAATQPTVFTNAGGFFPRVLNNALDRLTILAQQILERLSRVPYLPLGDKPVGQFPVVLPDGSFGWSSGTGSDAALRADLGTAAAGKGGELIAFQRTGGALRTGRDKLLESVSLWDIIPKAEIEGIQLGLSTYDISSDWSEAMEWLKSLVTANYFSAYGGKLVVPPGVYHVANPLLIDEPLLGGMMVEGYGAVLKPAAALTTSLIEGGGAVADRVYRVKIEGFMFDVRGNANVQAGILLKGGMSRTMLRDLYCYGDATTDAGFGFARLRQETVAGGETGQYWCTFDGCEARGFSGFGIDLWGAQNATRIVNCEFGQNGTAIRLYNGGPTGPAISNGVLVQGCTFEGVGKAISVETAAAGLQVQGLRVIGNRFEVVTTVLDLTQLTAASTNLPYLAGNYMTGGSVTNYVVDPNNTGYNSDDTAINPNNIQPRLYGALPKRFKGLSGAHALVVDANGKGIELVNGATPCGSISTRSGGGMVLEGGSSAQALEIRHIKGLSAANTQSKNFYGAAVFAGGTTASVAFPGGTPEPNVNYSVICVSTDGKQFWVNDADRLTTGYTVNASAAHTGTVRCYLVRYGN